MIGKTLSLPLRLAQPIMVLLPLLFWQPALADMREVFYPNNVLKARVFTKKNGEGKILRHGSLQQFHPNGRQAVQGQYMNGAPVGIWTWWDLEGHLVRRVRKDGDFEELLFGQKINKAEITFKNTAGNKESEGLLKYDKAHGTWQYWYNNGAPKAVGKYLSGIPDGKWVLLYPDGQIKRLLEYRLGIQHGLFLEAYPSGQESVIGRMEYGLREGLWRYYHTNGQKKKEGKFQQALEEGMWRYWKEDGTLEKRLKFSAGWLIEEFHPPRKKPGSGPLFPDAEGLMGRPHLFDESGNEIEYREE